MGRLKGGTNKAKQNPELKKQQVTIRLPGYVMPSLARESNPATFIADLVCTHYGLPTSSVMAAKIKRAEAVAKAEAKARVIASVSGVKNVSHETM